MSSRAAVAGSKKCSRVHIDKSVYDFVNHADCLMFSWTAGSQVGAVQPMLKL